MAQEHPGAAEKALMVHNKYSSMAGVVLAGGLSQRMGRDKALIPFKGRPLISYPLDLLDRYFQEVIIIAKEEESYAHLGFPVFRDRFEIRGALVGFHAALSAVDKPAAFVAACDMPFISPVLLELLVSALVPGTLAVVPVSPKGREPLLAVYSRDCLEILNSLIAAGDLRIASLLKEVATIFVPPEKVLEVDPSLRSFINLNSPEDFKDMEEMVMEENPIG
jgi:molybdopterin-guanine dinucleotide biosynthesis protein A